MTNSLRNQYCVIQKSTRYVEIRTRQYKRVLTNVQSLTPAISLTLWILSQYSSLQIQHFFLTKITWLLSGMVQSLHSAVLLGSLWLCSLHQMFSLSLAIFYCSASNLFYSHSLSLYFFVHYWFFCNYALYASCSSTYFFNVYRLCSILFFSHYYFSVYSLYSLFLLFSLYSQFSIR